MLSSVCGKKDFMEWATTTKNNISGHRIIFKFFFWFWFSMNFYLFVCFFVFFLSLSHNCSWPVHLVFSNPIPHVSIINIFIIFTDVDNDTDMMRKKNKFSITKFKKKSVNEPKNWSIKPIRIEKERKRQQQQQKMIMFGNGNVCKFKKKMSCQKKQKNILFFLWFYKRIRIPKKKFDNKLVVIVVFRSYTCNVSTLYHSQPIHSYGHNENGVDNDEKLLSHDHHDHHQFLKKKIFSSLSGHWNKFSKVKIFCCCC